MSNSRYKIPELALYYYDRNKVSAVLGAIQEASTDQISALGKLYLANMSEHQSRTSIAAQLEISRSDASYVYSEASGVWMRTAGALLRQRNDSVLPDLVSSFPALLDALSAVILFEYLDEGTYEELAGPFEAVFGRI